MILDSHLPLIYILLFIGTLAFSILLNRLMLRFSVNLGVRNLDEAGIVRWSSQTKPSVGGIPMYIIFLLSICVYAVLPLGDEKGLVNRELFGLFAACSLGFLIGLADDAYNTNPLLKFIGQLTCANILIAMEIVIEVSPSTTINFLFTIVWVVGLMNSINMLDNMDGITASISACIVGAALMVCFMVSPVGNHLYFFILIAVFASLIGFLFFNWHPSRIYMGDTGSQFLGVFLAAIGIIFFWNFKEQNTEYLQIKQFVPPLMIFILPIIDTTTVFLRRIARGQSPFVGGKDHTTHHLAFLGLKDGQVAAVFLILSLISVGIIFVIYKHADTWNYQHTFGCISYFLGLFLLMQILYDKAKRRVLKKAREEEEKSPVESTMIDG